MPKEVNIYWSPNGSAENGRKHRKVKSDHLLRITLLSSKRICVKHTQSIMVKSVIYLAFRSNTSLKCCHIAYFLWTLYAYNELRLCRQKWINGCSSWYLQWERTIARIIMFKVQRIIVSVLCRKRLTMSGKNDVMDCMETHTRCKNFFESSLIDYTWNEHSCLL